MNHPAAAALGSSPLTRGKRPDAREDAGYQGLIPAHAGKTSPARRASSVTRAHPRSRGENVFQAAKKVAARGSSPLTRGKRRDALIDFVPRRLIPAHAGKTALMPWRTASVSAHPRSRGENARSPICARPTDGSSPLTRGKRSSCVRVQADRGLIPAHAGKTHTRSRGRARGPAHPRSRGENIMNLLGDAADNGSSPLTRGKLRLGGLVLRRARLIPAHAGKTTGRPTGQIRPPAHPRSRGENRSSRERKPATTGSSPLTRGKHFLTCAFTAQIDQILETLELAASFGSYLIWVACATDAPQDPVRSIGLVLPSSRGAS